MLEGRTAALREKIARQTLCESTGVPRFAAMPIKHVNGLAAEGLDLELVNRRLRLSPRINIQIVLRSVLRFAAIHSAKEGCPWSHRTMLNGESFGSCLIFRRCGGVSAVRAAESGEFGVPHVPKNKPPKAQPTKLAGAFPAPTNPSRVLYRGP